MEACLYDPDGGVYTRPDHPAGTGDGSHFATSPTLHPFFAQAVADEVYAAWSSAGRPEPWHVAEFGAGTGDLARAAVPRLLAKGVPIAWTAVDVRAGRKAPGVEWSATAPERFAMAVANEFLDALPFRVVEWRDGWLEVGVGLEGDRFTWQVLGIAEGAGPPGRHGERRVLTPAVAP
jgi:SAM-dependent MidA family methyltransferase